MWADLYAFSFALYDHWILLLTSSGIAVALSLMGVYLKAPRWLYLSVLLLAPLPASFHVWREEHRSLVAERSQRLAEIAHNEELATRLQRSQERVLDLTGKLASRAREEPRAAELKIYHDGSELLNGKTVVVST